MEADIDKKTLLVSIKVNNIIDYLRYYINICLNSLSHLFFRPKDLGEEELEELFKEFKLSFGQKIKLKRALKSVNSEQSSANGGDTDKGGEERESKRAKLS